MHPIFLVTTFVGLLAGSLCAMEIDVVPVNDHNQENRVENSNQYELWANKVFLLRGEEQQFVEELISRSYRLIQLAQDIENVALGIIWAEPAAGVEISTRVPGKLMEWLDEEIAFSLSVNNYLYNASQMLRYLVGWYRSLIWESHYDELILTEEEMLLPVLEQWRLKVSYCHNLLAMKRSLMPY